MFFFNENSLLNNYREELLQKYIDRANFVTKVYQKLNIPAAALSVFCFIFLIIMSIIKRRSEEKYWQYILVLSGILCSLLVLCIGVSYTHISAFESINTLYLSGSYPLMLAFEWIAICAAVDILLKIKNISIKSIMKCNE